MSYKMEASGFKGRTSNEGKLSCELCQNVHSDIYYCTLCHLFCCSACAKGHQCPNEPLDATFRLQRIQTDSKKALDLCKRVSEGGNPRFTELSSAKHQWGRSCMRCFITLATRHCLNCKIKYYCEHCFKSLHGASKLATHKFQQAGQNKDKPSSIIKHQLNKHNKDSRRQIVQDSISSPNKSDSFFRNLQTHLLLIRKSLLSAQDSYEKEVNENIELISNSFEHLIEDAKLKLFEITMKVRENAKHTFSRLEQLTKVTSSHEKILSNLRYLQSQEEALIPMHVFQNKKATCQRQISELISLAQITIPKDQVDRKISQLSQQIEHIRIKILKADFKRGGLHADKMDSSKISSVSNNTSRNQKNTNTLKMPLNLANIKSSGKLTLSLATPKKNQNAKPRKQSETVGNKSLFQSVAVNSPEDQLQKSFKSTKGLYFDSKKKLQKKKSQNDKRFLTASMMSPKASIKRFDRNMENNMKSKIAKSGMNIQKTKKMISQIRNEMLQFSSGYNIDKEPSQICETERHILDVSQLSIQSMLDKSLKL